MPTKIILRVTQKEIRVHNFAELTEYGRANMEYQFQWPFEHNDIIEFHHLLDHAVTLAPQQQPLPALYRFGETLWKGFFHDPDFHTLFHNLIDKSQDGLQVHILLDEPAYVAAPWEYLYHRDHELSVSENVSLVRARRPDYGGIRPLKYRQKISVLFVVIEPPTDSQWQPIENIEAILRAIACPEIEFEILRSSNNTIATIQTKLRSKTFHIIQFLGHGRYHYQSEDYSTVDTPTGFGEIMVYERGEYTAIPGSRLATALGHYRTATVVLMTCSSGRTFSVQEYTDVASQLASIFPAVFGMQSSIGQNGAELFLSGMYQQIAQKVQANQPIHAVDLLVAGRNSLRSEAQTSIQAGIPVLYLQSPGKDLLFEPESSGAQHRQSPAGHTPPDKQLAEELASEREHLNADLNALDILVKSISASTPTNGGTGTIEEIAQLILEIESHRNGINYRLYQQHLIIQIDNFYTSGQWEEACNLVDILFSPPLDALPLPFRSKTRLNNLVKDARDKMARLQKSKSLFQQAEMAYSSHQWSLVQKVCQELEAHEPTFRANERDQMRNVANGVLDRCNQLANEIKTLAGTRDWGMIYLLATGLLSNLDANIGEEFSEYRKKADDFISKRYQISARLISLQEGSDTDTLNAVREICDQVPDYSPYYEVAQLLSAHLLSKTITLS